MSKNKVIRVELNKGGVRALLKSGEIAGACESSANSLIQQLGDGYQVQTYQGLNRVNVSVYTEDAAVIRENYKSNTVEKALARRTKT